MGISEDHEAKRGGFGVREDLVGPSEDGLSILDSGDEGEGVLRGQVYVEGEG